MLSLLTSPLLILIIFAAGYYFGYQTGTTRHIREQLARVRKDR